MKDMPTSIPKSDLLCVTIWLLYQYLNKDYPCIIISNIFAFELKPDYAL